VTTWAAYVQSLVGDGVQATAAARAGFSQATLSRWLRSERVPNAGSAMDFARAYGRSPVEALVVLKLLTETEALAGVSTADLAAELARRTLAATGAAA
jgi:transcriptional regulator with XRE-family HTH domain